MNNFVIRKYKTSDKESLKRMVVSLQDIESVLEEDRIKGDLIGDKYFKELCANCKKFKGSIFVLNFKQKVIGFMAIYIVEEKETISKIEKYGYISDVFIESKFRGKGLSRMFFEVADEYFKKRKIQYIKVCALAKNTSMINSCESNGFKKHEIIFLKEI